MSMTRKEVIAEIEKMSKLGSYTRREALKVALSSLRPISREQVEKVWKGEWRSIHGLSEYYCSRCGEEFEIHAYDKDKYQFCPYCMAPMTNEAVDILLGRLEALKDDSTTD